MGKIRILPDKVVVEMALEELIRQPAYFRIPEDARPGMIRKSYIGNLITRAVWLLLHEKGKLKPECRIPKITGGKVTVEFAREGREEQPETREIGYGGNDSAP